MRFSIIIPAHNAEGHIQNALDSIKEQSFTDYELIVICDSCTDNTAQIAREYGAIVEEVDFHNDGLSRSRGLDIAQGQWVMFMDDDDWWLHEFVLDQLHHKLFPHIDVLCFSFILSGVKYAKPLGNGGRLWPAVWNKVWRRDFIGDTRFPNVYAISDSYFHSEMMDKSQGFTCGICQCTFTITYDRDLYRRGYERSTSDSGMETDETPVL